jgi:hypothetical protein|tara:strand:+ start:761 stop:1066 length:306 start_codon:yes stop_codon:yes gene_type:complete
MPDFDFSKLIIVLVFLMILVGLQLILKRSKFVRANLGKPVFGQLKVINTLALSKFASASVIECAELSFLVVTGRNGTPSIVQLPPENKEPIHSDIRAELGG